MTEYSRENRKPLSPEEKLYRARYTRETRKNMRASGICVNGWSHGKAYKGGRCYDCWMKKKASEKRGAP